MNEIVTKGVSYLTLGLTTAGTALACGTIGYFVGKNNGLKTAKDLEKRVQEMEDRQAAAFRQRAQQQATTGQVPMTPAM